MIFRTNQKISSRVVSLVFGVLILCFALSFWVSAVWTEPGQAPPGGNVDTPLNVGPIAQTKEGGLILNQDKNLYGLVVDGDPGTGRVGIGMLFPDEKLDVAGNIRLGSGVPAYTIMNVADPTVDSDVATKGYVDGQVGGGGQVKTFLSSSEFQGNHNCDDNPGNCCPAGYHMGSWDEIQKLFAQGEVKADYWSDYDCGGHSQTDGVINSDCAWIIGGSSDCSGWTSNAYETFGRVSFMGLDTNYGNLTYPASFTIIGQGGSNRCSNWRRVWCVAD